VNYAIARHDVRLHHLRATNHNAVFGVNR
jgi:hypothetical protein